METVRIIKTKDGASLPPRFNLYLSNFEYQIIYLCLELISQNSEISSLLKDVEVNAVRRLLTEFLRADS